MKKLEKYTGEKVYMFPSGRLATHEAVYEQFPAAEHFAFVVETDNAGEVMYGMYNLASVRAQHDISAKLSDDEAIAAIEEIINTPVEVVEEITAEERIAAALEAQVMMAMPDVEDDTTTESEVTA